MPFYLIQVSYKDTATRTLIANPQTREDAIAKTCASLGGKLHSFFFAFGDYDVVCIAEVPDNITAAAIAMATASKGAIARYHTTVLMKPEEGLAAMKKAQKADYAPPQ
jgi:uncharacterized protein with GYD domain